MADMLEPLVEWLWSLAWGRDSETCGLVLRIRERVIEATRSAETQLAERTRERDEARAAVQAGDNLRAELWLEIDALRQKLEQERDAARAEVERLREALGEIDRWCSNAVGAGAMHDPHVNKSGFLADISSRARQALAKETT